MKTVTKLKTATSVAARVAGEDIQPGDYVTVLDAIYELPSFYWDCLAVSLAPDEPVRLKMIPEDAGLPCKVQAVCLPFVYVRKHCGAFEHLDLRKRQLVRLDRKNAKVVWKELRRKRKKSKKK